MNGRTSKVLRKFASEACMAEREIKRIWNRVPRSRRHLMRAKLRKTIA